ncbi:methyl-accepting chemotaxis protein [Pseudomonas sp. RW407]|uniref:methyl-accepting chemotaxis protein n=1 Tax=Pseudomonas sp. RW407 TaxID=2202894 RepID=UPI000D701B0B|nr:methyl-accepting chemotaxis protein [Pseudomonas sp. RW407]PWU28651.1 methyl-accepting chemotaxis protein [Pseudomonas sp. RW407]
MNLRRLTRSSLLITIGFLALGGLAAYQQYQLVAMRGSLEGAAEKTSINALLNRVGKLDERVDAVAGQHLVKDEDFRAAQQALSNRIDAAQAYAKQANDSVSQLSQSVASTGELLVLKANLETLNTSLQDLKKPQAQQPAPVAKKATVTNVTKTKPSPPKPKPAPPEPPPFHIIGVEYRGGERFLSIAPPGSTRLSQIYLIRPGDSVAGTTWRLSALDDRTARFDAAGTTKTISLQP